MQCNIIDEVKLIIKKFKNSKIGILIFNRIAFTTEYKIMQYANPSADEKMITLKLSIFLIFSNLNSANPGRIIKDMIPSGRLIIAKQRNPSIWDKR